MSTGSSALGCEMAAHATGIRPFSKGSQAARQGHVNKPLLARQRLSDPFSSSRFPRAVAVS